MTTSTASKLSRPRSPVNEAVVASCKPQSNILNTTLSLVSRAFVGSTFSKPFNTSNTRVVISSFVRPAAAEKAARWCSQVRLGMAAAEVEIRFRAKLAAGPRKATRRKAILWAGVTRTLRAVACVSGLRLIPNPPSGNAADQCHV